MIVYVVAGGDYPDSVWASQDLAEKYIAYQRAEDERNHRRIAWRSYRYTIRNTEEFD